MAKEGKKKKNESKKKAVPSFFDDASAPSKGGDAEKDVDKVTINANEIETIEEKKMKLETEVIEKPTLSFDWDKPIYLQMHRENLYSIFSSAIITPARYYKNRAFPDAQSVDDTVLSVSNGHVADLDSTQVLCEIFLTDAERKYTAIHSSVCHLGIPIPISRISKIYTVDELTKKEIVLTARSADGGIIPERLFESSFPVGIQPSDLIKIPNDLMKDHSEGIRRNDRILGAFAFVKNYSWLRASRTNSLTNVPVHLLYMLNVISDIPALSKYKNDSASSFYRQLFGIASEGNRPMLDWIFERINAERNFTDVDIREFANEYLKTKNVSSIAIQFLNDLTDSLKRKKAIQEIWNSSEPDKFYLYLFGFLRLFGNSSTEDKSTSRKDLPQLVVPATGEYIFASLGYFYGYKLLRNYEEDVKINDLYFSKFLDSFQPLPLKFDLSSSLEYFIIEATYQFVFHSNIKMNDLEFPIDILPQPIQKVNLPNEYTFDSGEILGTKSFNIQKKSEDDILTDQLGALPDMIPAISEIGVYCYRSNVQRSSLTIQDLQKKENEKFLVYFKKEHIIEAIKNNKMELGEFFKRFTFSKRSKEL